MITREGDVRTVRVPVGGRSYDVIVGEGVRDRLPRLVPRAARRAVVVTQAGIEVAVDPGIDHEVVEIGRGEHHKSLATVELLCDQFAAAGLTRNDVIVAVGGGMVTDVAGLAAALWHRGVAVVHVPTTLLGMIDAAIGGKTGVNLAAGKNLVGAFWQPAGVLCDLDALAMLPAREMRCGLGEMAKYHFLTGDDLLAMDLPTRISRCVEIKADIVAADEREDGGRALLNYGHTLAHALEIVSDFTMAHGEAVAIGLVYAAHLAAVLGRIDQTRVEDHYRVVGESYHLDTRLPAVDHDQILALMGRDKKAVSGLTFVLDSSEGVGIVHDVDPGRARDALSVMAARGTTVRAPTVPPP